MDRRVEDAPDYHRSCGLEREVVLQQGFLRVSQPTEHGKTRRHTPLVAPRHMPGSLLGALTQLTVSPRREGPGGLLSLALGRRVGGSVQRGWYEILPQDRGGVCRNVRTQARPAVRLKSSRTIYLVV
jgi:hypothetical protein